MYLDKGKPVELLIRTNVVNVSQILHSMEPERARITNFVEQNKRSFLQPLDSPGLNWILLWVLGLNELIFDEEISLER